MVMTAGRSMRSSQRCEPRYATPRRPERETFGPRLAKIAQVLGVPFMPWQHQVADVACEMIDGVPAYSEVGITVPRQSGKTTVTFAAQMDRALNWGRPQRSAFTAQTGKDARDKWLDELVPMLEGSPLNALVKNVGRANGNEGVYFKTGSLIRLLSTSASTGHSKTLDQAVLDEIWHDIDDRREQGLRPAMITRTDRQLWWCSTAGTDASLVYNRKVTAGRQAVRANAGTGIAYFEWSAPDDWDPADQDSWWGFMPALGHTITPEAIEVERLAMEPDEFRRAYGNRATRNVTRLIPIDSWAAVVKADAAPEGKIRFALDITEDRGAASIVAGDQAGTFELVDHRPGVEWVPARVKELDQRYGARVIIDAAGPAASLEGLGATRKVAGPDVVSGCQALYDAILGARVTFRQDPMFDEAVSGVVKRELGDRWAWSRKASVSDITPLMAATLVYRVNKPSVYESKGIEFV